MTRPLVLIALLVTVTGCVYKGSLYADRPKNQAVDRAIDRMWAEEIRAVARDGDWILSRSLSPEGDMIATLVGGMQVSHASVVDVTNGTVVEATTPEVREIPLEELMQRNWYVMVVRPHGLTDEMAKQSLELQRMEIGKEFDLWGFIGYEDPDKWYCSELVYWASGMESVHGKKVVVLPNALVKYGDVIYYSGRRDDAAVQEAAAKRMNIGHDTAIADVTDGGHEVELQTGE